MIVDAERLSTGPEDHLIEIDVLEHDVHVFVIEFAVIGVGDSPDRDAVVPSFLSPGIRSGGFHHPIGMIEPLDIDIPKGQADTAIRVAKIEFGEFVGLLESFELKKVIIAAKERGGNIASRRLIEIETKRLPIEELVQVEDDVIVLRETNSFGDSIFVIEEEETGIAAAQRGIDGPRFSFRPIGNTQRGRRRGLEFYLKDQAIVLRFAVFEAARDE